SCHARRRQAATEDSMQSNAMPSFECAQPLQKIEVILEGQESRRVKHVTCWQSIFTTDFLGGYQPSFGSMASHCQGRKEGHFNDSAGIYVIEAFNTTSARSRIGNDRKRSSERIGQWAFKPLKCSIRINFGEVRVIAVGQIQHRD